MDYFQVQEFTYDYTHCLMDGSSKTCAEVIGTFTGNTCNCSIPFSLNEDFAVCCIYYF